MHPRHLFILSSAFLLAASVQAQSSDQTIHFHATMDNVKPTFGPAVCGVPKSVIPTGVPRTLRHAVEGSWHDCPRSPKPSFHAGHTAHATVLHCTPPCAVNLSPSSL